jgi:serine O-acetyltransferase
MDQAFIQHLYNRQSGFDPVPSNQQIADWAANLICLLFPEKSECQYATPHDIELKFAELQQSLTTIFTATKACACCNIAEIAQRFFNQLPAIYETLQSDKEAILSGDPAAHSEFEVIRAYPGFLAICFYRLAHGLHQLEVPVIPRILTEQAHGLTGIDIHPAAAIGRHFCIDHGTGIVIGETATIGEHVKVYQGVTLGALSVDKSLANTKRHPTVEDHVVIYSNATILGGNTTIGHHSIIGGNVWLTRSVPPHSKVYHKPEIQVEQMETHFPLADAPVK